MATAGSSQDKAISMLGYGHLGRGSGPGYLSCSASVEMKMRPPRGHD